MGGYARLSIGGGGTHYVALVAGAGFLLYSAGMTILNLMLGRGRGGLEQVAADYADALALAGIGACSIISPHAWVQQPLAAAARSYRLLPNLARWDVLAMWKLRRMATQMNARAIICHGNRAVALALCALGGRVPIIAVAHNNSIKRFHRANHCFAITQHLAAQLRAAGSAHVSHMPNMVRVPPAPVRAAMRTPVVIGAMGRLDAKKGFDVLLDALVLLNQRGLTFHAMIGGDGEEHAALTARIAALGLGAHVRLVGWVEDKREFFEGIDLFVVPSRQEAFGLTVIEAMAHGVPTLTSDADGPREIATDGVDALVTPRGDAPALADALEKLMRDPAFAARLGVAGRAQVEHSYSLAAMAGRLQLAMAPYIETV